MEPLTPSSLPSPSESQISTGESPLFPGEGYNSQDSALFSTPTKPPSFYRFIRASSCESPLIQGEYNSQDSELLGTPDRGTSFYNFPLKDGVFRDLVGKKRMETMIALPVGVGGSEQALDPLIDGLVGMRCLSDLSQTQTQPIPTQTIITQTSELDIVSNPGPELNSLQPGRDSDDPSIIFMGWGVLVSLNTPIKMVLLKEENKYIVGRGQIAHFRLKESHISYKHFTIEKRLNSTLEAEYFIRDDSSKNGTYINGKKIPLKEDVKISSGDIVHIHGRGRNNPGLKGYFRTSFMFLAREEDPLNDDYGSIDEYQFCDEGCVVSDDMITRMAVHKDLLIKFRIKYASEEAPNKDIVNSKLKKEAEFYSELEHDQLCAPPHLVEDHLIFQIGGYGNLGQYLKRNYKVNQEDAKLVMVEILNALTYLKSKGITLHTLSLDSIMVNSDNPPSINLSDYYSLVGNNSDALYGSLQSILLSLIYGLNYKSRINDLKEYPLIKEFYELLEKKTEFNSLLEAKWLTLESTPEKTISGLKRELDNDEEILIKKTKI